MMCVYVCVREDLYEFINSIIFYLFHLLFIIGIDLLRRRRFFIFLLAHLSDRRHMLRAHFLLMTSNPRGGLARPGSALHGHSRSNRRNRRRR